MKEHDYKAMWLKLEEYIHNAIEASELDCNVWYVKALRIVMKFMEEIEEEY